MINLILQQQNRLAFGLQSININLSGNTSFLNNLTINSNLNSLNNTIFNGNSSILSNLNISGSTLVQGSITNTSSKSSLS